MIRKNISSALALGFYASAFWSMQMNYKLIDKRAVGLKKLR